MEGKQQILKSEAEMLRDQFILFTFQTPGQWEMKTMS